MSHPVKISCFSSNWRALAIQTLSEIREINLIHFLFSLDFEFRRHLAAKYSTNFTGSLNGREGYFGKPTASKTSKISKQ